MPASDQGVAQSHNRYRLIPRVLCFVTAGEEVLLLKGAPTKKIWPNKFNGLGGHVERGESPHAAAEREIREEAGLQVLDLRLRGVVTIDTREDAGIGLYVFTARALARATTASSEGSLVWVPWNEVHALDLVEDLPRLLARLQTAAPDDKPFGAHYAYAADGHLRTKFFEG